VVEIVVNELQLRSNRLEESEFDFWPEQLFDINIIYLMVLIVAFLNSSGWIFEYINSPMILFLEILQNTPIIFSIIFIYPPQILIIFFF
jgi:hypothetical protein